jgi:hypothetical protein
MASPYLQAREQTSAFRPVKLVSEVKSVDYFANV